VASYRAGFLPEERRQIERDLFAGRLDGVISTSALEMGIDVGGLDACILVGYPGSVMATWQRSGRVGRADRESITALVALPDALDQFLIDHPQELLERPCERLVLDPANEPVSRAHVICAASELPLRPALDRTYLERHAPLIGDLLRESELLESADGDELYSLRRRPQRQVNLRGSGETFVIVDEERQRTIGTIDGVRVLHECFPGAIYLHGGRQYLVQELDRDARRVKARAVSRDYFTTPLTDKETEILEVLRQRQDGSLHAWLGRLKVTERVVGYQRKRIYGQEPIDQHPLQLPPVHFETVGLWWIAPPEVEATLRLKEEHFMGSLHATEHAAISLLPLLALCDRRDIGGISLTRHAQIGCGAVFIYDGHPGGVGICARGFEELPELLTRVLALLEGCSCEKGCPSCVQSPKCGNGNRPLDKAGAARILRLLLEREAPLVAPEAKVSSYAPSPRAVVPEGPVVDPEQSRQPAAQTEPPPEAERWVPRRAEVEPAPEEPPTIQSERPATPSYAPEIAVAPPPPAQRRQDRFASVRHTVLFDLETLRSAEEVGGWGNSHRMGVAVGVVCHMEENRFETFAEEEVRQLVAALRSADLVVGFNVKRFDYQVLAGYTGEDFCRTLRTLDLLEEVRRQLGRRLGLSHLARETLGEDKTADGLQSLEWVRQGRLDLVEAYCRKDVEILRDLYLFGRREGYLVYKDKRERRLKVPVDW
jgi:DEAD/DEAH box helicase domain-containing protein